MQSVKKEEIPFDVVPLPSKGRLYDEDHPLYAEESIQFKAMSNVEENILHSKGLIKKGLVVDELIKSCLINKSINPQDLLIGDKTAILTAIRISGLGAEYTVKTMCPECDESYPYTFDLSKCEIKSLGKDPDQEGKNLFSFVLPKSKQEVKFKLLTSGDEADISKTQEQRRKALRKHTPGATEVDTNITDRLTKQIVRYGGEKEKTKIARLVKDMKSPDSRALRQYIRDIEPDLLLEQEVECPHCGMEETHPIPMGIEFLWPKLS